MFCLITRSFREQKNLLFLFRHITYTSVFSQKYFPFLYLYQRQLDCLSWFRPSVMFNPLWPTICCSTTHPVHLFFSSLCNFKMSHEVDKRNGCRESINSFIIHWYIFIIFLSLDIENNYFSHYCSNVFLKCYTPWIFLWISFYS